MSSSKTQNIPLKSDDVELSSQLFKSLASIIDQIVWINKIVLVHIRTGWLLLECECLGWLQILLCTTPVFEDL